MKPDPCGEPARSPAATRTASYRARRRAGLRCVTIQVRQSELDLLVKWDLLAPEQRTNRGAITQALHRFLDNTLGRTW
jgi:hypothetical protein